MQSTTPRIILWSLLDHNGQTSTLAEALALAAMGSAMGPYAKALLRGLPVLRVAALPALFPADPYGYGYSMGVGHDVRGQVRALAVHVPCLDVETPAWVLAGATAGVNVL